MTIEESAEALDRRYRSESWYTAVGIGTDGGVPTLFVYVKSLRQAMTALTDGWEGFQVRVRKMGDILPAQIVVDPCEDRP